MGSILNVEVAIKFKNKKARSHLKFSTKVDEIQLRRLSEFLYTSLFPYPGSKRTIDIYT